MESRQTTVVDVELGRVASPSRTRLRPLLTLFAVLGLIVIGVGIAGLLPRLQRERGLQAAANTERAQLPVVNTTRARTASTKTPLELPGDLQAVIESPIFARADGYLSKRYVDIGDKVVKGQPLADIETPELDQQIQQARANLSNSQSALKEMQADLALAEANLKLSEKTDRRWHELESKGVLSHQEADEKSADYEAKLAQVEVAKAKIVSGHDVVSGNEANLQRLQQLKSFARVTAPFDGIITARNVNVGTLINAGNGGARGEMFRVADLSTMRIFVNVPQAFVNAIHKGETADLRVQELPDQVFSATVARFTHEVDMTSRSMLAILLVPNPKAILLPGMYAQVNFATTRANAALLIPGDALIFGAEGPRAAVADADGRVHFRKVRVGNDFGNEVEILSGLAAGDRVIANPADTVREGARVEVREETHK